MMSKSFLDLKNGVFIYDDGSRKYTQEEVDQLNKEHFEYQESFIPKILEAGYIEFPVMYNGGEDNPIWSRMFLPPTFVPSNSEGFVEKYGTYSNFYIPSYGRAGIAYTNKTLDSFGIENYYFCVDPDQWESYVEAYGSKHVIVRDWTFKKGSKLYTGSGKILPEYLNGGAGAALSVLYIARALGERFYWNLDDDIFSMGLKAHKGDEMFPRDAKYDKEKFYRASSIKPDSEWDMKAFIRNLEEFAIITRNHSNVTIEKFGLTFIYPIHYKTGTRAYTFYLSDTELQVDRYGRQNSDTVTSMEMNKSGLVNILVTGYCYDTPSSQIQSGGETVIYRNFGTLDKTQILVSSAPNYSKISFVYNRIHHKINYNQYRQMRLVGASKEKGDKMLWKPENS